MTVAITGASLIVNNETVGYMPNSLKYDLGNPERTVSPQVVGDGATINVISENYETAKSKVMFDLKSTLQNENLVLDWVENLSDNVVKVVTPDGTTRVFEGATLINKPEFDTGADGVVSLEFESDRAVVA